jgi:hypothetical protein
MSEDWCIPIITHVDANGYEAEVKSRTKAEREEGREIIVKVTLLKTRSF